MPACKWRPLSPEDAAHGGESWIVPSVDHALVDEPRQLALGHDGVGEVEAGVGPDVGLAEPQGVDEPEELLVAVHVLRRPKRVTHPLHAVHDRAGEVVRGVHLGFSSKRGQMFFHTLVGTLIEDFVSNNCTS